MLERPSARQFYNALMRGGWQLDRFEALIGEETDRNLLYVHDKTKNAVTVYKARTRLIRNTWSAGSLVILIGAFIVSVFIVPALEEYYLWSNVIIDFTIVCTLALILLDISARWIFYRFVKVEPLYEIELDDGKVKEYKRFRRDYRVIRIILALVLIVIIFSQSYYLTYLRFLADGGYGGNTTAVQGEIDHSLGFDDSSSVIEGAIKGLSGAMEQIDLYLEVDRCPDAVSIYINGEKVNISESYVRVPWYFIDESYFENVIHAGVEFHAREINTLEIKAGGFSKIWTFRLEQVAKAKSE